jgi:hypothetical protein
VLPALMNGPGRAAGVTGRGAEPWRPGPSVGSDIGGARALEYVSHNAQNFLHGTRVATLSSVPPWRNH